MVPMAVGCGGLYSPLPWAAGLLHGGSGTLIEMVPLWGSAPQLPSMRAGTHGGRPAGSRAAVFLKQKTKQI